MVSFRAKHSKAKNLENIYVDVFEILPPSGRLNDDLWYLSIILPNPLDKLPAFSPSSMFHNTRS